MVTMTGLLPDDAWNLHLRLIPVLALMVLAGVVFAVTSHAITSAACREGQLTGRGRSFHVPELLNGLPARQSTAGTSGERDSRLNGGRQDLGLRSEKHEDVAIPDS